jgi:hypothetical protein
MPCLTCTPQCVRIEEHSQLIDIEFSTHAVAASLYGSANSTYSKVQWLPIRACSTRKLEQARRARMLSKITNAASVSATAATMEQHMWHAGAAYKCTNP